MFPQNLTTHTRSTEHARRGSSNELGSQHVRPHSWNGDPLAERFGRQLSLVMPEIGPTAPRQAAPSNDTTESVLSAGEFERCLARERNLADRGTRLFSLMVLRCSDGKSPAWPQFAQCLRDRLRSTDLVGQLDADRVAVLLTDTAPEGARVVARWVDLLVTQLGVCIDPKIYVYPSLEAAAPVAATERGGGPHSASNTNGHANGPSNADTNGQSNGQSNGHTNGHSTQPSKPAAKKNGRANRGVASGTAGIHAATSVDDRSAISGHELRARDEASADAGEGPSAARWPVAELWTQLSLPMPLWKRSLDIFVSALALLLLAPLFIAVAIAIKLDSPGPVIFRQLRAGRCARPFAFYKFRSMFVDAEQRRAELEALNEKDGPIFKIHNDPRITRVGRSLRRWSIDELPQLWNILKGDISLVGPRSPTFNEVAVYERWQRKRLNVTGGVTGIWQVSGRSQISFQEWMRMDMQYVKRRCLSLDLWLLARTVPAVLSGRGAY